MKKKNILLIIFIVMFILSSCESKTFIDDGNGHKQYKDENGNYVKNQWVEIKGNKYYFDMNGYLSTNQWINDEYYVDENGIMKTDYWYDDKNGGLYYLDNDGKYLKNTIKDIDGSLYAFDTNGKLVKNLPYVSNGQGYYFGNDGKVDKTEGYKSFADTYCFVDKDGKLLTSSWREDNGKWYYFNEIGLMLKNSFVDGGYYVDGNGEMVKNKQIQIGNDTYVFDDSGIGSIIQPKKISLLDIKNRCCYKLMDGTPVNTDDLGLVDISVTSNELEIKAEWPFNKQAKYWAQEINKELGLPSSLSNRISKTDAKDGMQTFSQGNISVVWKVTNEKKIWNGSITSDFEIVYTLG